MEKAYEKLNEDWYANPVAEEPRYSLHESLQHTAARVPEKTSVICLGQQLTYAQLEMLSNRFAAHLIESGVKKGDRVATMMPNITEHLIVFYGIIKAGATIVPFNVMLKEQEITYILNNSGAKTLVILDMFKDFIPGITASTDAKNIIISSLKSHVNALKGTVQAEETGTDTPMLLDTILANKNYDGGFKPVKVNPQEDLALILYTAGTTGTPKGVMLTHYNFMYNTIHEIYALGITEDDVSLILFPLFHVSGYMLISLPLVHLGGTVVLHPRFEAEEYLQLMHTCRVTMFAAPPTVYTGFLSHPNFDKYDISSLRLTLGCGAPVPGALQAKWKETVGFNLTNGYGLTETSAAALTSLPGKSCIEEGCIGVPVGGDVAIGDKDGNILPRGEMGEILFRGPQVAEGYWNNPRETAAAYTKDGWLKTGDAGYMNENGFTFFVERIKDLIVASGYNIAPAEIESYIVKHPDVEEAAVIGVPHEYRGETVKAFVVLKEGSKGKVTEEEIIEFCKNSMAAYKYPRIVQFIDELPKSASQKVLRRALKEI